MTRPWGRALTAVVSAITAIAAAVLLLGPDPTGARPRAGASGNRTALEPASSGRWVGTWSASPATFEPGAHTGYPRITIRNVVHVSVGGSATRIHLSNVFGTMPLRITGATVALAAAPSSPNAAGGTVRRLTFAGRTAVVVPAGRSAVSDPVRLRVPDSADLLVTTYTPDRSGTVTYHPHARQISYLARGDHHADLQGTAFTEQTPYWRYLSAVDVWSASASGSVVALGDSITDGITSTAGANHRWTDFLASRLLRTPRAPRLGVLNQGISGNRVLSNAPRRTPGNGVAALSRFDRDVAAGTGASVLVVELGVNDILKPPQQADPDRIAAGLRRITARAHARGLRVVGATLMPFEGHRNWSPRLDAVRQAVNERIRSGRIFDAVVDFDRALRDPLRPTRLRPVYDSGDHLHPSDRGFQAMADSLDLNSLKAAAPAAL
ncbi:SGNH/GDSL hydrolase family protein [Wenjunlia tyrosinilytica]|uniref:SGNH hydrolase n=1 Tax=Wenjunlia tyrosinilytica TaxID=1544741 RepID=A0A917ZRW9_9ACTN|nr:SGNH/GDSL hydrolase family protein [Wenjunlia tyrosinilytica]GGO89167.1 SGNH hydrolase [Wenjunlia tyrosinilytica]